MNLKPGFPSYGQYAVPSDLVGSYIKKMVLWIFVLGLVFFLISLVMGKPVWAPPPQWYIAFIVFWEDMKMHHNVLMRGGWIIEEQGDDS